MRKQCRSAADVALCHLFYVASDLSRDERDKVLQEPSSDL